MTVNKLLLSTCVCAVPVALAAVPPTPADLRRDVASMMPASTLVYVEAPGLAELAELGLQHPLVATLLDSPLGDLIREQAKMSPEVALGMLNFYAGRPVLPAVAKLSADGVALGISLADGEPVFQLAARGDAATWEEVVELAMTKVAEAWGLPLDKVVPPHKEIRGVDVWVLGDTATIALDDGVFLASNREDALRQMIDLAAAEEAAGLAANPRFQRSREGRGSAPFLWSWVDLNGVEELGLGDGFQNLRAMATQPAPHFLLGSAIASLGGAEELTASLRMAGDSIELGLRGYGVDEGAGRAVLQPIGDAPPPLPRALPDEAARGMFYRDLAGLFRHRVDLFPSDVQPKFAEATTNLALFFGGADLSDELLPSLSPWIGVIARDAEFDEGAVPEIPLPSAAFLVRMAEPEVTGPQMVTAFQTFVSILNVNAAQEMQPSMMLQLAAHEGSTITFARFRTPKPDEGVDLRYNLVPACAQVGDTFVLGTHVSLVKQLVAQLSRGELEAAGESGDSLVLSGAQIAQAVRANEDALVMNSVLNDGKQEQRARQDVRGLILVAELIERLELTATRTAEDEVAVTLRLSLAVSGSK